MKISVSNNKLLIITSNMNSIRIGLDEEIIEFEYQETSENHYEIDIKDHEVFSLNTLYRIKYLTSDNEWKEPTFDLNGCYPIYYSFGTVGILTFDSKSVRIKFIKQIEFSDILVSQQISGFKSIKHVTDNSYIEINEVDEDDKKNLVVLAVQPQLEIVHFIPATYRDGKFVIPSHYNSGLYDIHLMLHVDGILFSCFKIESSIRTSSEKSTYTISKISDDKFQVEFVDAISPLEDVFILYDNHFTKGTMCDNINTVIFQTSKDLIKSRQVYLLLQTKMSTTNVNMREDEQFYDLDILSDYIDPTVHVFPNDIVSNSIESNLTDVEVSGSKIKFKLPKDHMDTLMNDFYLLISERKTKELYTIKGVNKKGLLQFNILNFLEKLDYSKGAKRWDLYLLANAETLKTYQLGDFDGENVYRPKDFYPFFDRFIETNSTYSHRIRLYITKNRGFALVKNSISNLIQEEYKMSILLNEFQMKKNKVNINFDIKSPYIEQSHFHSIKLIHRNKDGLDSKTHQINKIRKTQKGFNVYGEIDLLSDSLYPLYWDLYLGLNLYGREYFVKVSKVAELVIRDVNETISKYQLNVDNNHIIYPYITIGNQLAFMYRKKEYYENRYYLLKESIAYYYVKVLRKYYEKKDIWIAFEKLSMSAHDSGYHFFNYAYQNNKHKSFYYVIGKDSPELHNLKDKKDKILYFMSFKYFVYMFAASLLISSDTKRNSYNLRQKKTKLGKVLTNKKLVYLQHGVNGLKVVKDFYKNRNVFDLVIAASNYEKNMIEQYWGYAPTEVVATGLARWDVMEDKTVDISHKQIFVMPTWRTWMDGMPKEEFIESDYYKYYNNFLTSSRLDEILKKHNIKIKFFLHPKFVDYVDLFETTSSRIEKFKYLEVPLDEMIMQSSIMISDYSSVIWEMFYLKKPCIFYHFDIDKYMEYEGTYMDMEKDLFGDVVDSTDKLIDTIQYYVDNQFKEKDEYASKRNEYFNFMDNKNSERIYQAIQDNKDILYKDTKKKNKFKLTHIIPFKIRRKLLDLKDRIIS